MAVGHEETLAAGGRAEFSGIAFDPGNPSADADHPREHLVVVQRHIHGHQTALTETDQREVSTRNAAGGGQMRDQRDDQPARPLDLGVVGLGVGQLQIEPRPARPVGIRSLSENKTPAIKAEHGDHILPALLAVAQAMQDQGPAQWLGGSDDVVDESHRTFSRETRRCAFACRHTRSRPAVAGTPSPRWPRAGTANPSRRRAASRYRCSCRRRR